MAQYSTPDSKKPLAVHTDDVPVLLSTALDDDALYPQMQTPVRQLSRDYHTFLELEDNAPPAHIWAVQTLLRLNREMVASKLKEFQSVHAMLDNARTPESYIDQIVANGLDIRDTNPRIFGQASNKVRRKKKQGATFMKFFDKTVNPPAGNGPA